MKKRKLRKWKMWLGYTEGKPDFDLWCSVEGDVFYGAIYKIRRKARDAYEDVRPVEVRELK